MRILVPVDGSRHSLRAAGYMASNLAGLPYSKVLLLAVVSFIEASLVSESPITVEQFVTIVK